MTAAARLHAPPHALRGGAVTFVGDPFLAQKFFIKKGLTGYLGRLFLDEAKYAIHQNVGLTPHVAPAELATYCLYALTAAGSLSSQAAVRRLISVTLSGLRAATSTTARAPSR